ncbi:hypothetical protein BS47DRAFT_1346954 [Hydnum rufescens UP504]|uniref:Ubiquitin-activating enzyme E1-like n=1 Tax=Hydnum rufescens UP504 TaxID=1448309 RepID=A0A9P6DU40_9AGAM|nr:hypothetical protein BS47DRAFT_1346954 [Hydnum rufescens UP504]
MPRLSHCQAILGPELFSKLPSTRVLIVGAGGIGCELVKNAVLAGFGDITLLDLDTIDLSNLNRQFLFRKKDVKQPKAIIAARTVSAFNPSCKLTPIHGNIKDPEYDVTWFKGFHIVLNALDNLDARRHVNRMCMAAGTPLIESGTAGYLGQVQPLLKDATECFDCVPKPTPKSFPVCTIRSTPSAPIHCIVWAKSYLFPQLFGEDDDASDLDAAAASGENAIEIDNLRQEASAFKVVRASLLSLDPTDVASSAIFTKVFTHDIERLLTMSDMWRSRKPPVPLDRDSILAGAFSLLPATVAPSAADASAKHSTTNGSQSHSSTKLKDQKDLTLRDNVLLFDSSLKSLASRLKLGREGKVLAFDKDDDDALDFVTATSNLRAWAYGITPLTRWEVKEMAGNIIPAIATTNAVISGLIVIQALQVLRSGLASDGATHISPNTPKAVTPRHYPEKRLLAARNVFLQGGRPSVPLGSFGTVPPNAGCSVCRETYIHVQCDPGRVTLGTLVDAVLTAEASARGREERREISVYEADRVLSEPDWDENLHRTLADLGCGKGKFITLVDEDEVVGNVALAISESPATHPLQGLPYRLPVDIHPPPLRPARLPRSSPPSSPLKQITSPVKANQKRLLADSEIFGTPVNSSAKRVKTTHLVTTLNGDAVDADVDMMKIQIGGAMSPTEAREAQTLEEEGLVMVEGPAGF